MEAKLPLKAMKRMFNIKNSLGLTQGMIVPSEGKSGGFALLWKPNVKVDVQPFSRGISMPSLILEVLLGSGV